MRILHIGLGSHFTENMGYQDNILIELNAKDGHEVFYIADAYIYKDCDIVSVVEENKMMPNGVRLIRLKYDKIINQFISNKIRKVSKLKDLLTSIEPDVIMFHGLLGYELMTAAEYVKANNIKLYADCHAEFTNSAKTLLSKILYRAVYSIYIKRSIQDIEKILYLSTENRKFLKALYKIPDEKLEFYPLGGIIPENEKCEASRSKLISELQLSKDAFICTHSGKLVKEKKTEEILKAINSLKEICPAIELLIVGSIPDDRKEYLLSVIEESDKIHFLGWKKNSELYDVLCGSDMYLQPGTPSATSQMAFCCGCVEVVSHGYSYEDIYGDAALYANDENGIREILKSMIDNPDLFYIYKEKTKKLAKERFDYTKLSKRYLI